MSFVLQDDTGTVADANAYIDLTFFKAYHGDRNVSLDAYEDVAIQGAIIMATDYIDTTRVYQGERLAEDQTTEFPRACLYYRRGPAAEGLFRELKNAAAEYALEALRNGGRLTVTPTSNASGTVLSESRKIGPIENSKTYAQGGVSTRRAYPADRLLREFSTSQGGVYR